jgi:hypothetical protein
MCLLKNPDDLLGINFISTYDKFFSRRIQAFQFHYLLFLRSYFTRDL